jgi:hypothetical protein
MQGLPWQDRMIETGRVYMDYAHRGFVMFLIGVAGTFNLLGFLAQTKRVNSNNLVSSPISTARSTFQVRKTNLPFSLSIALGGIGLVYSTIDIIRFTRAKSRIFREETGTKRAAVLHDALSAAATGKATLRQKLFLERYERVKQAEEERLRQRGPFKSVIDYMFPGVMSAATEATILAQLDDVLYVEMEKVAETPGLLDQPAPDARIPDGLAGEMAGGPLDLTAQGAVDAAEKSTKSWASWLGWR